MIAIIGHGPSMLDERYGAEIDTHTVIRQKRCEQTLEQPEQYGTRTDYIAGSLLIVDLLPKIGKVWGLSDSRFDECDIDHSCTVLKGTCRAWNKLYRERRTPYTPPEKGVVSYYSPLGHKHLSAGFHTILYACAILGDDIILYGFDSMKSGEFTWSVTRGPTWTRYPDHNWQTERDMIPLVEQVYGVKVTFR